jgi:transcriptional regulator of acetoin/glycerol metabolism
MAEKLVKDPERLVATIEASFPLPNHMDRYYGFEVQMFQIAMPKHMAAELVTAADQQDMIEARQKAVEQAGQKIHAGVESFVADCVASLREQTAQLCEDMLSSINSCETGVHQKTLNRLVRFIDQFKSMNFVNDRVMEQQLENVKKELLSKRAEEYRDSATARARLKNGLSQLANQAKQLARQDATELVQRFGEMGRRKFNLAA